jgi:hypothetical protein
MWKGNWPTSAKLKARETGIKNLFSAATVNFASLQMFVLQQ